MTTIKNTLFNTDEKKETKTFNVVKRDKSTKNFDMKKIKDYISFITEGTDASNVELEQDCQIRFKDNITTREISNVITQTAADKVQTLGDMDEIIDSLKWDKVARNSLLRIAVKDATLIRGKMKLGPSVYKNKLYDLVKLGVTMGQYSPRLLEYTEDEWNEFNSFIDASKDQLLTYASLKQLLDRYVVKEIGELPQERFIVASAFLALSLDEEERMSFIKKTYGYLSNLKFMLATPSLKGAGRVNANLASCNILEVDDNIESIFDSYRQSAHLSKNGAGIGQYWGNVRGSNSMLKGSPNLTNNIMAWLKMTNQVAITVDQLGTRKGAISVTLDAWHVDIFDFLNMRREVGEEKLKAFNLFPAVALPDLFIQRVENKEKWTLLDPYYVRRELGGKNLSDFYGREFEEVYKSLEAKNLPNSRIIDAYELAKNMVISIYETGSVFVFFRDKSNTDNPNKHVGRVTCSNLCTEIIQNTYSNQNYTQTVDENNNVTIKSNSNGVVECNLVSMNLAVIEDDELETIVKHAVKVLNGVLDMQVDSILEAKIHNERFRAIGLGTAGYHSYLVKNRIPFESDRHIEVMDKLYEKIAYYAIEASSDLAKDKGSYKEYKGSDWNKGIFFGKHFTSLQQESKAGMDWSKLADKIKDQGMRNGYLLAIAPTSSISIIMGTSPGTDPVEKGLYLERNKNHTFAVIMPYFAENPLGYKNCYSMNQDWLLKAASTRQKWLDQSQSSNFFIDRSKINGNMLLDYIIKSNKMGLKSLYYFRSKNMTKEECINCAS